MTERNSYETHNIYPNICVPRSNQQQFKLNKINEIKDYFIAEIKEIELINSLIVLFVTAGSIFIASFASFVGAPVGMVSTSFSLAFSISTGVIKKLLKTTRNKKKKLNKIVVLSISKLNSIENKISSINK